MRVAVKIRHKHQPAPATIESAGPDGVLVNFDEPQRAITPGQAAVFYDGDTVVGGGGSIFRAMDELTLNSRASPRAVRDNPCFHSYRRLPFDVLIAHSWRRPADPAEVGYFTTDLLSLSQVRSAWGAIHENLALAYAALGIAVARWFLSVNQCR